MSLVCKPCHCVRTSAGIAKALLGLLLLGGRRGGGCRASKVSFLTWGLLQKLVFLSPLPANTPSRSETRGLLKLPLPCLASSSPRGFVRGSPRTGLLVAMLLLLQLCVTEGCSSQAFLALFWGGGICKSKLMCSFNLPSSA